MTKKRGRDSIKLDLSKLMPGNTISLDDWLASDDEDGGGFGESSATGDGDGGGGAGVTWSWLNLPWAKMQWRHWQLCVRRTSTIT